MSKLQRQRVSFLKSNTAFKTSPQLRRNKSTKSSSFNPSLSNLSQSDKNLFSEFSLKRVPIIQQKQRFMVSKLPKNSTNEESTNMLTKLNTVRNSNNQNYLELPLGIFKEENTPRPSREGKPLNI